MENDNEDPQYHENMAALNNDEFEEPLATGSA